MEETFDGGEHAVRLPHGFFAEGQHAAGAVCLFHVPIDGGEKERDALQWLVPFMGDEIQGPPSFLHLHDVAHLAAVQIHMGAHTGQQFRFVERFGNVINAAFGKTRHDRLMTGITRQEDDGDILCRRVGFDLIADFKAVHFRHRYIQ